MKVKVSLNTQDEWNDCWLETRYIGVKDMAFEACIYPTIWPAGGRRDGFYLNTSCQTPCLKYWIKECENFIKQPVENKTNRINERTIATMQTVSIFLKRIFPW